MAVKLRCPNSDCGKDDMLYSVEQIPGACCIDAELEEDGSLYFTHDETDVDWNGQVTVTNEHGHPKLGCGHCNTEWFEERVSIKTDDSAGDSNTD